MHFGGVTLLISTIRRSIPISDGVTESHSLVDVTFVLCHQGSGSYYSSPGVQPVVHQTVHQGLQTGQYFLN